MVIEVWDALGEPFGTPYTRKQKHHSESLLGRSVLVWQPAIIESVL